MKKIGRQVLFLATDEGNPRNGEGSFVRLKNNAIMFGYTGFCSDDWEDDAAARISAVFSYDEGETWQNKKVLFVPPEGSKNIMCLSFVRLGNGDIGAFYIVKNPDLTDTVVLVRSADEGESWSAPVRCLDCLDVQDYYVINNDRVARLRSGRLILPLARHTVLTEHKEFMPGEICFVVSDDDGASWYKTEAELKCPFAKNPDGYEEPGIYEMADGRLWCYIRTSLGFQYEAFSEDEGITWSTPEPNLFFSSACSPMLIKDSGEFTLAVFNPVPAHALRPESEPWGRTPYVLALSTDRGKTFDKENMFYIEDDLTNGYCYPAVIGGDGYFLLAYYHSNNTGICLNSTKIIKVMYDELKK